MSEVKANLESKEVPTLDIFIRMNNDEERDYCFHVKADQTFGDLLNIFKTLPLNLSPSIYYDRQPIAFKVSNYPGYLTKDGGLLFGWDAGKDKYLKPVSNDSVILTKVWPGQLLIPVFPERTFLKYSVTAALLVWLYTDLPDCISPTPGLCLTNQGTKALWYILTQAGYPEIANNIYNDMFAETAVVGQWIFFVFHFVKVIAIYFLFSIGLFNPYSFTGKKPVIERDDLIRIGWTGAKKATVMSYQEFYRTFRIQKAGGTMKAFEQGIFDQIRVSTVELGEGEGFNTPLGSKADKSSKKFKLNYAYLTQQEEHFHMLHSSLSDQEFTAKYKDFRRYGPLDAPEGLTESIKNRFELGEGDVKENEN